MKNGCCVPNCKSKRRDIKLHCIPKTDIGLKWVELINSVKLKNLTSKERNSFFVCHKHFEKRFVTNKRLRCTAYPTLFTDEEIETGIPALPYEDSENILIFHNYSKRTEVHNDHSYCQLQDPLTESPQTRSNSEEIRPFTSELAKLSTQFEHIGNPADQSQPSFTITVLQPDYCEPRASSPASPPDYSEPPASPPEPQPDLCEPSVSSPVLQPAVSSGSTTRSAPTRQDAPPASDKPLPVNAKPKTNRQKKTRARSEPLSPEMMRLFKKIKKSISTAKRYKPKRYTKKDHFEKITKSMNPLAKQILWMQVNQCKRAGVGRRFTDSEKLTALSIMKESPTSYKFLRKVFILPSVKTINAMVSKMSVVTVGSEIDPNTFQPIECNEED